LQALYAGFLPYFFRFFAIAYVSQIILDLYVYRGQVPEFWSPRTYMKPASLAFNAYDPHNLTLHKMYADQVYEDIEETKGANPELKSLNVV
jgi:hypothetical protein